ncbi:uncharacterized protein PF3D7_1120000-like [Procambarus clarkii]|uniref:uncharacterized protein PF3D7_1120000-like n=1 Tax=Procambarus clarkii TaxID=6728 RepID=UPI003742E7D5
MVATTEEDSIPTKKCFAGISQQDVMKDRFLGRLVIIEDILRNYEEKVIKLEQENEGLKFEFCNLKGSIFQQGKEITSLTNKVRIEEKHIKELVKDNEAWKVKSREYEEINKKIESYGKQLQGTLRANMELGKEIQRETLLATQIEETNKELEKYKEEIKETYAQVVKEKETIKEVCLEVKTRNDKQEADLRQAIRKEPLTNSKLVQNTIGRMRADVHRSPNGHRVCSRSASPVQTLESVAHYIVAGTPVSSS